MVRGTCTSMPGLGLKRPINVPDNTSTRLHNITPLRKSINYTQRATINDNGQEGGIGGIM
jgi:hypothetical protein